MSGKRSEVTFGVELLLMQSRKNYERTKFKFVRGRNIIICCIGIAKKSHTPEHQTELKYDKGDLVVMNREHIDPANGFISEGTLLKNPKQSGWVDLRNFNAKYEKIQSTFNCSGFAKELCIIFIERLGIKCDELNDYVHDMRLMYKEANEPTHKEFLEYLIRLRDFFYYFRKLLEADENLEDAIAFYFVEHIRLFQILILEFFSFLVSLLKFLQVNYKLIDEMFFTKPCCLYQELLEIVLSTLEIFNEFIEGFEVDAYEAQKGALNQFKYEFKFLWNTFNSLLKTYCYDSNHSQLCTKSLHNLNEIVKKNKFMEKLHWPTESNLNQIALFKAHLEIHQIGTFMGWSDQILIIVQSHQIHIHVRIESKKSKIDRVNYGGVEYDVKPLTKLPLFCRCLNVSYWKNGTISNIQSEVFNFSIDGLTVNMVYKTFEKTINFDSANIRFNDLTDATCFMNLVYTYLNIGRKEIFIPQETYHIEPNSKVRALLTYHNNSMMKSFHQQQILLPDLSKPIITKQISIFIQKNLRFGTPAFGVTNKPIKPFNIPLRNYSSHLERKFSIKYLSAILNCSGKKKNTSSLTKSDIQLLTFENNSEPGCELSTSKSESLFESTNSGYEVVGHFEKKIDEGSKFDSESKSKLSTSSENNDFTASSIMAGNDIQFIDDESGLEETDLSDSLRVDKTIEKIRDDNSHEEESFYCSQSNLSHSLQENPRSNEIIENNEELFRPKDIFDVSTSRTKEREHWNNSKNRKLMKKTNRAFPIKGVYTRNERKTFSLDKINR